MFCCLLALIVLMKTLLFGLRIVFRIKLCETYFHIEVGIRVWRIPIPALVRLKIEWSQDDGVFIFRLKRNGNVILLSELGKPKDKSKNNSMIKGILSEANRWLKLTSISGEGCVGIREDAFLCVMLTGALDSTLRSSFQILLNERKNPPCVNIRPDFTHDLFRLNLEGMFHVRVVQIIIAALKWYFPKRGIGNYVSSYREHHENDYGAN